MGKNLPYKVDTRNNEYNYCLCKSLNDDNDFPMNVYLHPNQLKFTTKMENNNNSNNNDSNIDNNSELVGHKFKMGYDNTELIYEIMKINYVSNYYVCNQINNINDEYPMTIHLQFDQLKHTTNISHINEDITSDMKQDITTNNNNEPTNDTNNDNKMDNDNDDDIHELKKQLPYFCEYRTRNEVSVLKIKDYKNDPEGYLKAVLDKYNVNHPKKLSNNNNSNNLTPWIEGNVFYKCTYKIY